MSATKQYRFNLISPLAYFDLFVSIFLGNNRRAQFALTITLLLMPFFIGFFNYYQIIEFEQKKPQPFLSDIAEQVIREAGNIADFKDKIDITNPLINKTTRFSYDTLKGWGYKNIADINTSVLIIALAVYLLFITAIVIALERSRDQITTSQRFEAITHPAVISHIHPDNEKQATQPAPPKEAKEITALELLKEEIVSIKLESTASKASARWLLVSGVIMCFVGIGIFYVTIPQTTEGKSISTMTYEAIRPIGMLIFIEALAWFLLKQYRSVSDEYVRFLKASNRSANLLSAFLTLNEKSTAKERQQIIEHMLKTNDSIILKKGETTEYIENQKISNKNPVLDPSLTLLEKLIKSNNKNQ